MPREREKDKIMSDQHHPTAATPPTTTPGAWPEDKSALDIAKGGPRAAFFYNVAFLPETI
jgi:hypothetical protein